MKALSSLGVTLTLIALSSSAQTHFCIGGNLDELTVSQVHSCQAKSNALRQEVMLQGAPADWRFITVCDEGGWEALASLAGKQAAQMVQADQSTDERLRVTFVRGSRLQQDNLHQVDVLLTAVRESLPQVAWRAVTTTPARPLPSLSARVQMPATR